MKSIFDNVDLGKLHLKNRLIRSATWEGLADESGHMPEALYQTYEELCYQTPGHQCIFLLREITRLSENTSL